MLSPGDRLGPYEVVAAVGAGGMGEVYRCRDTRLGPDVALKVLPPRPPDARERMLALLDDLESGGQLPELPSGTLRVGFQRKRDGTAVSSDVPLAGEEYLSQGLYLLGAPNSFYSAQTTGVALRPVVGDGIR